MEEKDNCGRTAAHVAASKGHVESLRALKGADVPDGREGRL